MKLGTAIQELRKQKNITQEELAAELGVTAAAVSKWENGYTLPDVLMLCALADFFAVTTDDLLGRNTPRQYAVIATDQPELGNSIKHLAESYSFIVKGIYPNIKTARDAIIEDQSVNHLFASFSSPLTEEDQGEAPKGIRYVEVHSDNGEVLDGFELYFKNRNDIELLKQKHSK